MTIWLAAVLALLPPLIVLGFGAWRGSVGHRLVAFQAASAVAIWMLVLMTFVFDQENETDLPLTAALLSPAGSLLLALVFERWV